jgi:hypothetical protein
VLSLFAPGNFCETPLFDSLPIPVTLPQCLIRIPAISGRVPPDGSPVLDLSFDCAEIGGRCMSTPEITENVSSLFTHGVKGVWKGANGIEIALCQKITGTNWKKTLANLWNGRKITKKVHAGRGQKSK